MKLVHSDELKIWPQIHALLIQKSWISPILVCQELDDEGAERLYVNMNTFINKMSGYITVLDRVFVIVGPLNPSCVLGNCVRANSIWRGTVNPHVSGAEKIVRIWFDLNKFILYRNTVRHSKGYYNRKLITANKAKSKEELLLYHRYVQIRAI